jgi:hypothetical protein
VEREIGEGATAQVYLARDTKHDRRVALKILRPELANAVSGERFLREIRVAAGLQHPNILALYDSGETADSVYFVMPYVEGETLRERLDRAGALPVGEAVHILTELADALTYAQELGATHLLDLATLTGPMTTALGDLYAGLFASDDVWGAKIREAAEASGDHAWPWPLHPRYRRYIDSDYADMKNSSELRQGVPVLAAEFLHEFVGDVPWAHLDIAGTAFLDRSRGDYLSVPGGTGYGVRLIVELAENL